MMVVVSVPVVSLSVCDVGRCEQQVVFISVSAAAIHSIASGFYAPFDDIICD